MTSREIKSVTIGLGADLCGIAPLERFEGAPAGFRPDDISKSCRSVLVFAKRVPAGSLHASSCIPYTFVCSAVTGQVDALALDLSSRLSDLGIGNVPVPSDDPSEYWEPERSHARGVLSLRHAGWLAGLGVLGRSSLLINDRFGSMIHLGALLLDAELEGDPPATYEVCAPGCRACIESCPRSALDGVTVDQQACRVLSNYRNERGFVLKKCWECRRICPGSKGISG